ncbi:MAG: hypothetical protein ACYS0F_12770, partial [Planctomycetota bacterium]
MAIRRLIGSMRIVALLAIGLLASCGPIAIALGISEALKDEAPDLGPPSVRFFDATGFGAPPAFVTLREVDPDDDDGVPDSQHVELMVRVDKPGVRVRVNVVGPFDDLPCPPFGAGDPAECPSPFPLTEGGVQAVGALDFLVTRPIGGLDGVYTLYVEIVDPKGRVISAAHQFLVDTTPPAAPGLIAVTARRPRALLVSWTTVQDLPERDNPDDDAVSGVAGYNIYFEVGPPEIAGATDPPDPTIEIPEEDEDDVLRSGLFPSA